MMRVHAASTIRRHSCCVFANTLISNPMDGLRRARHSLPADHCRHSQMDKDKQWQRMTMQKQNISANDECANNNLYCCICCSSQQLATSSESGIKCVFCMRRSDSRPFSVLIAIGFCFACRITACHGSISCTCELAEICRRRAHRTQHTGSTHEKRKRTI